MVNRTATNMRKTYLNFVIELEPRIITSWFTIFSFERRRREEWEREDWEQRQRWQSGTVMTKLERWWRSGNNDG